MNRIKTELTGGFSLKLDDFRFIDNTLREGIVSIVKSIANSCILWGCVGSQLPGGIYEITEGFVFFNDELFYCPAQSVVLGQNIQDEIVLQIKEYDSLENEANRVFASGSANNVWLIREVEVINLHAATEDYITIDNNSALEVKKYIDIIRETSDYSTNSGHSNNADDALHADNADNALHADDALHADNADDALHSNNADSALYADELAEGSWIIPTLNIGWTGSVKYRRIGQFVEIRGTIIGDGTGGYSPFNIITTHRPDIEIYKVAITNGSALVRIQIFPGGNFQLDVNAGTINIDEFYSL